MKKVLIIIAVVILAGTAYFLFNKATSSLSANERDSIDAIFSGQAYLESHANEKIEISKSSACEEILQIAEAKGWTQSVKDRFFDGGSIVYSFGSRDSNHKIEVFCRWDLSKGGYESASITIK